MYLDQDLSPEPLGSRSPAGMIFKSSARSLVQNKIAFSIDAKGNFLIFPPRMPWNLAFLSKQEIGGEAAADGRLRLL